VDTPGNQGVLVLSLLGACSDWRERQRGKGIDTTMAISVFAVAAATNKKVRA